MLVASSSTVRFNIFVSLIAKIVLALSIPTLRTFIDGYTFRATMWLKDIIKLQIVSL